jgi:hypothetical protein
VEQESNERFRALLQSRVTSLRALIVFCAVVLFPSVVWFIVLLVEPTPPPDEAALRPWIGPALVAIGVYLCVEMTRARRAGLRDVQANHLEVVSVQVTRVAGARGFRVWCATPEGTVTRHSSLIPTYVLRPVPLPAKAQIWRTPHEKLIVQIQFEDPPQPFCALDYPAHGYDPRASRIA